MLQKLMLTMCSLLLVQIANAERRVDPQGAITYPMSVVLAQNYRYLLYDEPISCDTIDQCKIWSYGFTLTQSYTDTPTQNAGTQVQMELWEGSTKIETSAYISVGNSSGTKVGRIKINLPRSVTPSSQTHIKFYASTVFVGNFDWPRITSLTPRFGIGAESLDIQTKPSTPTIESFVENAPNKYTTLTMGRYRDTPLTPDSVDPTDDPSILQSADLTDDISSLNPTEGASAEPIQADSLEMSKFTSIYQNALLDVDMATYKKTVAYGPILNTSYYNMVTSGTTVPQGTYTFTYPTWGYYRSRFKITDYEGKTSGYVSKLVKSNPYLAPTSLTQSYSSANNRVTVNWVKPVKHKDGTAINPAEFQGYIVYLRNDATNKILYTYKVMGYTTSTYTTPNAIPAGTYELVVCGWSTGFAEGSCRVSLPLTVP